MMESIIRRMDALMADNEAKNEKIVELEERIAAIEGRPTPIKDKDETKRKARMRARITYIVGRLQDCKTISAEVVEDIVKFTTIDDEHDASLVETTRNRFIDAFKIMWYAFFDQELTDATWETVIAKIHNIAGLTDKDTIMSKLVD